MTTFFHSFYPQNYIKHTNNDFLSQTEAHMGYDIGFHAIKKSDIDYLCKHIAGKEEPTDFFHRAVTASQSRSVANAWGLALKNYESHLYQSERNKIKGDAERSQPGFFGKLFGRKALKPDYSKIDNKKHIGNFDSQIHVWGRPFFIYDDKDINSIINQYLLADTETAELLAQKQLNAMREGLHTDITPNYEDISNCDDISNEILWKIDLFKDAYRKLGTNELVCINKEQNTNDSKSDLQFEGVTQAPNEIEPEELFRSDFFFCLIESASRPQPTWMDRGYVWPSRLLSEIGVNLPYAKTAESLIDYSLLNISHLQFNLDTTINENYSIGAIISPADMEKFQADLYNNTEKIMAKANEEGWLEQCVFTLAKLFDCIDYCRNHSCYFVESSDIYSAPMGIIS